MPPRILLLQQGDPSRASAAGSGSPYYLARALERAGADVIVKDCEPHGASRYLLAAQSFSPKRPRWVGRFNIGRHALAARSAIASHHAASAGKVDAIVQYGSSFDPHASAPVYCFVDNFIHNTLEEPLSWARQLPSSDLSAALKHEQALFSRAAGIFAFSRVIGDSVQKHCAVPASRVSITYPGPNFSSAPVLPEFSKRSAVPTVLFIGRAWAEKGGAELLQAFERVRSRVANARLVVAGPRTAPDGMAGMDGVEFLGFISKDDPEGESRLRALFDESWLFCLPTRYESFGMVFVEAMWHGLPTIGTDSWAIPEIIDEGVTGFRVALNDVDTLARRMETLLTDATLRARMSDAARQRAERLFSWDSSAATMLRVIAAQRATA